MALDQVEKRPTLAVIPASLRESWWAGAQAGISRPGTLLRRGRGCIGRYAFCQFKQRSATIGRFSVALFLSSCKSGKACGFRSIVLAGRALLFSFDKKSNQKNQGKKNSRTRRGLYAPGRRCFPAPPYLHFLPGRRAEGLSSIRKFDFQHFVEFEIIDKKSGPGYLSNRAWIK